MDSECDKSQPRRGKRVLERVQLGPLQDGDVLHPFLVLEHRPEVLPITVLEAVAWVCGFPPEILISAGRSRGSRAEVDARALSMLLVHVLCNESLNRLCARFHRISAAVWKSITNVEQRLQDDIALRRSLRNILASIERKLETAVSSGPTALTGPPTDFALTIDSQRTLILPATEKVPHALRIQYNPRITDLMILWAVAMVCRVGVPEILRPEKNSKAVAEAGRVVQLLLWVVCGWSDLDIARLFQCIPQKVKVTRSMYLGRICAPGGRLQRVAFEQIVVQLDQLLTPGSSFSLRRN